MRRTRPTCIGPMLTETADSLEATLRAMPPVAASTTFCNTISRPKVANTCIIGSPWSGLRRKR